MTRSGDPGEKQRSSSDNQRQTDDLELSKNMIQGSGGEKKKPGGGFWSKFDILLDRTHLSLRGHETAFLTALCLFCTCLCVFVTDRHLALEWRVASVEAELARLQEAAPPPQLQPPALTRERRSAAEAADQEQEARTGMSNGQF